MQQAEFREASRQARLGRHLSAPTATKERPSAGSRVLDWLADWEALQAEYHRRCQVDPRRVGDLLYPALKLAPPSEDGAYFLNCIAIARTNHATSVDDLSFAIRGFQAALARSTDATHQHKVRINLAWAYNTLGTPHLGERLCCEVFTLLPADSPLQFPLRMTLGFAWAARGAYAEAHRAYRSALELAPPDTSRHDLVINNLASFSLFQERFAEAQEWFDRLPADHTIGAAWVNQGFLALHNGDATRAVACVERAFDLISIAQVNWRERYSLALGYRIIAAASGGEVRARCLRVADHFAGITGGPHWLKLLSDSLAAERRSESQSA